MWTKLGDLTLRIVLWAVLLLTVGSCSRTIFMAMRAQCGGG